MPTIKDALESLGFSSSIEDALLEYTPSTDPSNNDLTKIPIISHSKATQHQALLRIFWMAGYFDPKFLWQSLHLMKLPPEATDLQELDHSSAKKMALELFQAFKKANAYQDSLATFSPEVLLSISLNLSIDELQDWLLYIAQTAFDREANQLRSSLQNKPWMETFQAEFLANAGELGLRNSRYPDRQNYDETWIQGARASRMFLRIKDLRQVDTAFQIAGGVELGLSGSRVIDDLDGTHPTFNKKFTELGLTTEADAMHYLLESFSRNLQEQPSLIVSKPLPGKQIADTAANAKDAVRRLLDRHRTQLQDPSTTTEFHIRIQTNNPFIDRQVLTTERAVNEILAEDLYKSYNITFVFHGTGAKATDNVKEINSEIGALIAERFMKYIKPSINPSLMFQTRWKLDPKTDLTVACRQKTNPASKETTQQQYTIPVYDPQLFVVNNISGLHFGYNPGETSAIPINFNPDAPKRKSWQN
jgi:hypothetical protein